MKKSVHNLVQQYIEKKSKIYQDLLNSFFSAHKAERNRIKIV